MIALFPSSLQLILLTSSCLLFSIIITPLAEAADSVTRDQLYNQNGLVQNWIAPMPTTPITSKGGKGRNSSLSGEKYIVQNWSTTYKHIAMGGNDISFTPDPYNPSGGPVLQVNYPKGSFAPSLGPVMGGAQFYAIPFGNKTSFEKMMVSYDVAFPNGFNWVQGGKLPGVYGGAPHDGCSGGIQSTGDHCLTVRLMWRSSGAGEVYAYVPAGPESSLCKSPEVICNDEYGKSIGRGQIYFPSGVWNRIDVVMALNEPAGNHNGMLQVYMNGNLAVEMNNIPYRSTGMVGFQGLMFSSFFGGSDASYATPVDTQVYFKNIQLSVGEVARLYEGTGGSGSPRVMSLRSAGKTILLTMVAVVILALA
ncbi:hypothetical protein BX616_006490 [Lobosporangium transversale]|uniref:Polysaccharide lyase 14 domain-containing protein n=1 Tax=Lobosporangium transversale TaxID=64571 RepID=A0A1Y2H132_9FUNG|nr:hypothetical protein BCR41DRAFT_316831 [Lobosporangium transversale]KAF9896929.1 hypothetical protein BX616_006490 [Lobosporangium transversale]ORZ28267.1 hypothetical protein BCR41DRAFT_316831 [Lobosporangium transversale]|eukprot:XP_021885952.1 hypothetical protein BCR41DRAFT_316831 [Lobosporangium transversale]